MEGNFKIYQSSRELTSFPVSNDYIVSGGPEGLAERSIGPRILFASPGEQEQVEDAENEGCNI